MEFNNAVERAQLLTERRVTDIVRDWVGKGGFRDTYLKNFASKGQEFANEQAENWLGSVEDFKGVDQLKALLQKAGHYNAKVDDPLFKIVETAAGKLVKAKKEMLNKRAELAAKERENRDNQLVDMPKSSIS
jgi:hypothetical protein